PNEIRVYPGANGGSTFYADAGDTYAYTSGSFENIALSYNDDSHTLTMGTASGSYPGMPATRQLRVVFVGPQHGSGVGETTSAPTSTYTGQTLNVASSGAGSPVGSVITLRAHANNMYVT